MAPRLLEQVNRKVDDVGEVIRILGDLITNLLDLNHDNPSSTSKISWKAWVRVRGQVQTLSTQIRDARRDIAADLTLLTA